MHITDLNSLPGTFGRLRGGLRGGPKLGVGRYGSIMCIKRLWERARVRASLVLAPPEAAVVTAAGCPFTGDGADETLHSTPGRLGRPHPDPLPAPPRGHPAPGEGTHGHLLGRIPTSLRPAEG